METRHADGGGKSKPKKAEARGSWEADVVRPFETSSVEYLRKQRRPLEECTAIW
jgi:hypothetical protein